MFEAGFCSIHSLAICILLPADGADSPDCMSHIFFDVEWCRDDVCEECCYLYCVCWSWADYWKLAEYVPRSFSLCMTICDKRSSWLVKSHCMCFGLRPHTVKFLGFTQKKLYNEFYAGNHLVWYPRPQKNDFWNLVVGSFYVNNPKKLTNFKSRLWTRDTCHVASEGTSW